MSAAQQQAPLKLSRRFQAPRERVFKAWTDPEELKKWWLLGQGWRLKNKANHGIVDELMTPGFQHHFKDPRLPKGREGMKLLGGIVVRAFPDVHANIQDLIAEGDKVVERTEAGGTHKGEFNGVPPSGQPVKWSELHVYRVDNGKIAELWSEIDFMAIMMQIGAIPAQ